MRVLICPQEFKGTLTATEVAEAIRRGVLRANPSIECDLVPMSDGGPGFLDALEAALGGERRSVECRDPLLRRVQAPFLLVGEAAYIEAAQANGLLRLAEGELSPLFASTEGVGDLVLAAVEAGARELVIGVGGSATNDGGSGMARVLGAQFVDEAGETLGPGAAPLAELVRLNWSPPPWLDNVRVTVATDVTSPLLGPEGAARVFGPQKGASPSDVDVIEDALGNYARVLRRVAGRDIASVPGAGAAGGLGAGCIAFLNASVRSGFDVVAEAVSLADRVASADLVITGEGSYDSQSAAGKVTDRVQTLAEESGRRCLVLAGRADRDESDVFTLVSAAEDSDDAMRRAGDLLEQVTEIAIRSVR
jgi:glycerate 2-kinase